MIRNQKDRDNIVNMKSARDAAQDYKAKIDLKNILQNITQNTNQSKLD